MYLLIVENYGGIDTEYEREKIKDAVELRKSFTNLGYNTELYELKQVLISRIEGVKNV